MKKCLNCGKEFTAKRKTAKYCSDTCKLAYHRTGVSVSKEKPRVSVSNLSREELYDGIDAADIRGENWMETPEYEELGRRINKFIDKRLEEEGYFIPNWKWKTGNKNSKRK